MSRSAPDTAFETLIYTDCLPGQGLRGQAGLQFQARSAGADRAAMTVVQRNLLYEPPAAWMRDRRPVSEYPPSFAHIAEGLFCTAAGVYLGREANGGREGNQLTHAIVTDQEATYSQVRPAQLFQAPFWTAEPAPTTTCPAVEPGWQPGPFDAFAAQEFVIAEPAGRDRLIALVTALDRVEDGQRVLFIGEDVATVLRWITAGTLLVPQEQALRTGFKVFTTNPSYATQPVVAVHPDWGGTSASVDHDSGYVVFDLTRGGWSPIEPTQQAIDRVDMFCAEDPMDVIDLIQVAAGTGEPPAAALRLGQAMILPDPQLSAQTAELAVDWLSRTDPDRLAAHRATLVDQLTVPGAVEGWPHQILLTLDAVAARGHVPPDRVGPVRLALIRLEVDRVARGEPGIDGQLPELPVGAWPDEFQLQAEDRVAAALSDAGHGPIFDTLLGLAHRFRLAVRLDQVGDAVDVFVSDWAWHPERNYDTARWPCREQLADRLRAQLNDLVIAGHGERIGDGWWARLEPTLRLLETHLDRAVLAAAMVNSPAAGQLALAESFLAGALRHPTDANTAVRQTVSVLWSRHCPRDADYLLLCRLLPAGPQLPVEIFEPLDQELTASDRELSRELLDLGHRLVAHQLYVPPQPVQTILGDDRALAEVGQGLGSADRASYDRHATAIGRADPRVVTLWRDQIAAGMLLIEDPARVAGLISLLPHDVRRLYHARLSAAVSKGNQPGVVFVGFYLAHCHSLDANHRQQLFDLVTEAISRLSDRKLKLLADRAGKLGRSWAQAWAEVHEAAQNRPRWWQRRRGEVG